MFRFKVFMADDHYLVQQTVRVFLETNSRDIDRVEAMQVTTSPINDKGKYQIIITLLYRERPTPPISR